MAEDDCLLPTYNRAAKRPKENLKMYLFFGLLSFTISAVVTVLITQFAGYRIYLQPRVENSGMLPGLRIPSCMIALFYFSVV